MNITNHFYAGGFEIMYEMNGNVTFSLLIC